MYMYYSTESETGTCDYERTLKAVCYLKLHEQNEVLSNYALIKILLISVEIKPYTYVGSLSSSSFGNCEGVGDGGTGGATASGLILPLGSRRGSYTNAPSSEL